jgi:hypothetical protein
MAVGLAEFKTTFPEADSLEITLNQRCPDTPTFFVKETTFVASRAQNHTARAGFQLQNVFTRIALTARTE